MCFKAIKSASKIRVFLELISQTRPHLCRGFTYNYCIQFLCSNCTIISDVVSCAIVACKTMQNCKIPTGCWQLKRLEGHKCIEPRLTWKRPLKHQW